MTTTTTMMMVTVIFIYKCEIKISEHIKQLTAWQSACQAYAPARTVLESYLVGR